MNKGNEAIIQQILSEIEKYQTVIIQRHRDADPDAIGSQVGLAQLLRISYPHKTIYTVGEEEPIFDWIGKMQSVEELTYSNALVIVVDTPSCERISGSHYFLGAQTIKIDHHVNMDPFADLNWTDESFSSASEMIYYLVAHSKNHLKLDKNSARCLYAGIVGDTGRFLYDDTSSYTFFVASKLLEYGFDAPTVNRFEEDMSPKVAKLMAYVLQNVTILDSGLAYIILNQQMLQKMALSSGEVDAIIPVVGKITTVKIWAIFRENENHTYHANLRSKKMVVYDIAKKHHGGDHPLSSGADAKNKAEIEQIIEELNALLSD